MSSLESLIVIWIGLLIAINEPDKFLAGLKSGLKSFADCLRGNRNLFDPQNHFRNWELEASSPTERRMVKLFGLALSLSGLLTLMNT
jgi:hypothetical protein